MYLFIKDWLRTLCHMHWLHINIIILQFTAICTSYIVGYGPNLLRKLVESSACDGKVWRSLISADYRQRANFRTQKHVLSVVLKRDNNVKNQCHYVECLICLRRFCVKKWCFATLWDGKNFWQAFKKIKEVTFVGVSGYLWFPQQSACCLSASDVFWWSPFKNALSGLVKHSPF